MSGAGIPPSWEFGVVLKRSKKWHEYRAGDAGRLMFVGPREKDSSLTGDEFWGIPLRLSAGFKGLSVRDAILYRAAAEYWELDPDWP